MDNPQVPPQTPFGLALHNAPEEEFPVLKAFQGYLEAEREKARRKLILLTAFFGSLFLLTIFLFGCAFLLAVACLWRRKGDMLCSADRLVAIGMAFLSFGMLSGCLWAKQAWGTYWSWDPKETWAAATWCVYLVYIHGRLRHGGVMKYKASCIWLIIGFALLQMCWYGVNFLPSASQSMHSY